MRHLKEQDTTFHTDLPPVYYQIDTILSDNNVLSEFLNTRLVATLTRLAPLGEDSIESPIFQSVLDYCAAIYDFNKQIVHVGKWSDMHFWIADTHCVEESSDGSRNQSHYISCNVCILRSLPDLRILILDSLFGFNNTDLEILNKLGYVVMSPSYEWMVIDHSTENGIKMISSAFY